MNTAGWCNGSTQDFGSCDAGSIPAPAAALEKEEHTSHTNVFVAVSYKFSVWFLTDR